MIIALAALSTGQLAQQTKLARRPLDTVLSLGLCLTIRLSYEMSRSDCCCRVSRKLTSASSLSELQDGCGIKSVGNNWRFYSLSAAVPFASSEDFSVVLIRGDSVSSLCRCADFFYLVLL